MRDRASFDERPDRFRIRVEHMQRRAWMNEPQGNRGTHVSEAQKAEMRDIAHDVKSP
ncbi:hypothetical protein CBA19CS22_21375 [Caballeronia novacaledonica]|uniref:Uncharacterized protein n=1 Tax=Caballeronia novacaledonica TaxID=1544861 RepID=A0ACB5QVN5_9BURK|nr:hypothetical protein CBA19CS22_21375 [Caballeronia novacaledonica]